MATKRFLPDWLAEIAGQCTARERKQLEGKTMANKGNQNARKPDEDKLTSFLYIRLHPKVKAAYVKACNARGMKLSKWTTEHLNAAAAEFLDPEFFDQDENP